MKPRQQPWAGEGKGRAGGAVAEQRKADDRGGERLPLDDGEEAEKKHLVGECSARQEPDRGGEQHPLAAAHQRLPVSGTNATGRMDFVETFPAASLLTRIRSCVWNGAPSGITMRPPG